MAMEGKKVLVVGGGMAGMTAALEAAECGASVLLVEKSTTLGGRVVRLARYFPKLCPPTCGVEIQYRRIRKNPRVVVKTLTEVTKVDGEPGHYTVELRTYPRFVNDRCTACGECAKVCPVERDSEYDYGLSKTKAIYLPNPMAYPFRFAIDPLVCKGEECSECVKACKYEAIDLKEQPATETVEVNSIVFATGWRPYDATKLGVLGYGQNPDVVTNVMMERMLAEEGPTKGKAVRPSTGEPPKKVVFVQCAGSRDRDHLPYCSAICCGGTLKEVLLLREQDPDMDITVFYIDLRMMGRNEKVLRKVQEDGRTKLVRGKVAKVEHLNGTLVVEAEDTLTGEKRRAEADLVVLATGIVPNTDGLPLPEGVKLSKNGFILPDSAVPAAGCVVHPAPVAQCMQEATAAALDALVAKA